MLVNLQAVIGTAFIAYLLLVRGKRKLHSPLSDETQLEPFEIFVAKAMIALGYIAAIIFCLALLNLLIDLIN